VWKWEGSKLSNVGDGLMANETTYSFRSGRDVLITKPQRELTGSEIYQAILHGQELTTDSSAVGGIQLTGEKIRRDGVLSNKLDQGHEFWSVKDWHDYGHIQTLVRAKSATRSGTLEYTGPMNLVWSGSTPRHPDRSFEPNSDSIKNLMIAHGNRAVSELAPTAPAADLAVMVSELSKLPTVPGLALFKEFSPRKAGGEYLNVEFGIKPLIRDIQKLASSVTQSRKLVEQYRRDADRVVRRKGVLVDGNVVTSTSTEKTITASVPQRGRSPFSSSTSFGLSEFMSTSVKGIEILRKEEDVWFSGAFSYFLEETDSLLGRLLHYEQLANKLLGSRLSPSAVWELTPWSWLIDWFVDIGNFVARVDRLSSDSLVLRYGYVMRRVYLERSFVPTQRIVTFDGATVPAWIPSICSLGIRRVRSTPYGFGLDVVDFTPQRWAILAALGLTKSPGKLRTP
jgi:hypothetical protein